MAVLSSVGCSKPKRLGKAIDAICDSHHDIVITISKTDELLGPFECTHRMGDIS
jgi:hypothetical protein